MAHPQSPKIQRTWFVYIVHRGGWTACRKALWVLNVWLHVWLHWPFDCHAVNISQATTKWMLSKDKIVRLRYFIKITCYTCIPAIRITNYLCFGIPSLLFLKLHGGCCHFSFLNNPSERRICVVSNSEALLSKLNGLKSPCIINVNQAQYLWLV